MTYSFLANTAAITAPIVLVVVLVTLALLIFRASCGALGVTLKRRVLQVLDLSIVLTLVLLMVTVIWRFKVIG
jgi:hypothetical protein